MSQEPLIKIDNGGRRKSYSKINNYIKEIKENRLILIFLGVEPLVFFYGFVSLMQTMVTQQYIYYRVGIDHNLSVNSTLAFVCDSSSNSTADKQKTDRLQSINSQILMWMALGSAVTTVLTAPFYSVFSDRVGRRLLFLIPGFGIVLKSILEAVTIYYNWPLSWFIAVECFYGATGGYNFVIALAFSYVADRSSHRMRTFRLALVGIMVAGGALIASLSSGYWITAHGYFMPFLASAVISPFCFLFPLLLLQDSKCKGEITNIEENETVFQTLLNLVHIYTKLPKKHCILSIVILVMYLFYQIGEMSGVDIQTTYLMSYPICMDPVQLGYFGSINIVAINLGAGITTALLNKCLSDLAVIVLCLIFGIAYNLQMAFALSPLVVYIATASNLLSFSAFPFIRGFLSKRRNSNEQGALFGGLVLIETVCGAVTKVVMVYFYEKTFLIFHGMVYIFIGLFSSVALLLTIIAIFLDRSLEYSLKEKTKA